MKETYAAFTACIAVILMQAFAESPSAFAIHDHNQRQQHRQVLSRRNRAAVSYSCPMHSDIRSKSPGTCPKCLMKLVADKPGAKISRR